MNSGERSVSNAGSAPSWVFGNLEAWVRGYGPALKGIGRFNLELLALISRRWQAWLSASRHFGECTSPWEVAQEQLRFWQVAVNDYAQSAQRVSTTFGAWAVMPGHQGAAQRDYITVQEPAPAAKSSDRRAA